VDGLTLSAGGILIVALLIGTAGCASRDLSYRDLRQARTLLDSRQSAKQENWHSPSRDELDDIDSVRWRWLYSGFDSASVLQRKAKTKPADQESVSPWPLRVAVITYAGQANPHAGADECMILDAGFARMPAVLAAHSLYWDLRRSGSLEAVHFQPDSLAGYDVTYRCDTVYDDDNDLVLVVRWSGVTEGEARATIYSDSDTGFSDLLADDAKEAYGKLASAAEKTSRRALRELARWLSPRTTEELAVVRAQNDIRYYQFYDEEFPRLSEVLDAAQNVAARAFSEDAVAKRRCVLEACRLVEQDMCANASLAKRAFIYAQLSAKEPVDERIWTLNEEIKSAERKEGLARAGAGFRSFMGGVTEGMQRAYAVQTQNPYWLQQAEVTRQETQQQTAELMELAADYRSQATRLVSARESFKYEALPELERIFRDSPHAALLRQFFAQVDFTSVQRMRSSAKAVYQRTFERSDALLARVRSGAIR